MHKVIRIVILFTILAGFIACDSKSTEGEKAVTVAVLPFPNKVLKRGGAINLSNNFWVIANVSDSASSELAAYLVRSLNNITGKDAGITDLYSTRKHPESIKIELDDNIQSTSAEGYNLDITSSHIKLKAKSARGIYYGMQTLLQLLKSGATNDTYVLPKVVIKDSPTYTVRGIAIKQSQLNNLSAASFIQLLGSIKINAVFVIPDTEQDTNIKTVAFDNYLTLYAGDEISSDVMLLSYGARSEELEETYNSSNISSASNGIVLDLTSTTNEDLLTKLAVLAELSWSENEKHDYTRLAKLARQVLVTD